MSAIVGLFFRDGQPVHRQILDRMVDAVAHRGPDRADAWYEANVGLGHRMLWTTPESLREELPHRDKSGSFVITADARIDNREELIAALGLNGRPREEISDSELILGAYEKWGEASPERLLGDFAFALWDRRKNLLFCARDHMGVRPFYYYMSDKIFAFSSEIEALFRVPGVPRRLNQGRVADLLVGNMAEKTATFYEDIFRLIPARSMTVGPERTFTKTYWTLDPSREIMLQSDDEYDEAFYEIFAEAVRCRLRSAFPVGSELSGGLDSSSVACVARELLAKEGRERLHTFSAVYKEVPQSDESEFIDSVLATGGFEPHKVQIELLSPLEAPRRVLWDADEPSIMGGLSMPWGLAEEARRQGVRVLLNGYDGDTVVSHGTGLLAELAATGRWLTLARELEAFSRFGDWSRRRILRAFVLKPLAPKFVLRAWWVLHGRNPWTRDGDRYLGPISEDFAERVGLFERDRAPMDGYEDAPKSVRLTRRWHHQALLNGANQYALEIHGELGATLSVENRFPFYDRRLVEFCLALPPEQKMRAGWTRVVMRRAMANVLPDEVRWREGKGTLTPGLGWSLLMYDRKVVEDTIFKNPEVIEKYANLDRLRVAYAYNAVRPTAGNLLVVIRTVALALWLRRAGFS